MKSETNLELGDVAKDTITGFQGTVVAITYWLNGCVRVTLQSQELKDGKPLDPIGFDVEQLELVRAKEKPQGTRSGGPMPDQGHGK